MASFPPVLIMVVAAVLVALSPLSIVRKAIAVGAPLLVLAQLIWGLDAGDSWTVTWLSLELEPLRADKLSIVFGYVFAIAAALGGIYAWHLEDRYQQAAALGYAGTSIGVVFAGDLLTLVLFWELMALTSAYLVWAGGYPGSRRAGTRYLFVHMVGGSTLLAGVLWHLGTGGSLDFTLFEGTIAGWLVLGGFAINAAIVPLHAWLTDAYPEAGVTGSVFLSAFTTKTAVYVLARGFPGWEVLIVLGVVMALYGVVFAVLENDIRRLLAYHIISQVGYMVAGVGIGTETAINGAVSHAFAHVIYKGLLFMGAGAAIYATGRRTLTALGGISDRMKTVVVLYMVGAFAISAFPLFSGFVSKSLVIYGAEKEHLYWAVALLYLASVGTFLHTGLKLPYFTWFGPKRDDIHVGPVPRGMIVAMVLAAALCIGIGVYPDRVVRATALPEHLRAVLQRPRGANAPDARLHGGWLLAAAGQARRRGDDHHRHGLVLPEGGAARPRSHPDPTGSRVHVLRTPRWNACSTGHRARRRSGDRLGAPVAAQRLRT